MKVLNKPILAYMCYPLSNRFRQNKKEAEELALAIMDKNPNIYVLLAHNSTHYSDFNGRKFCSIEFDLAIIRKIDLFIIGKPLNYCESCGSVWEFCFAKSLGKKIVTSDFLLGKTPEPHLWSWKNWTF